MSSTAKSFSAFHAVYQNGIELLEVARQQTDLDLLSVANSAYAALAATPYGRALTADNDLDGFLDQLEAGLSDWIGVMVADTNTGLCDDHPDIAWAQDDDEEAVRRFLYWGRLGDILHHFRDQGRMLNTFWENNTRTVVRQRADLMLDALTPLSSDLIVQAVYDEAVLKKMTKATQLLQQLKIDLLHSPLDIDEASANPFHDGNAIIRRQFLTVISLMSFELFGNVTPTMLDRLLELKSSTAEKLELIAWPLTKDRAELSRASRISMMRENLREDLKLVRYKARKRRWQSRSVIEYFATHPEIRDELGRRRECD